MAILPGQQRIPSYRLRCLEMENMLRRAIRRSRREVTYISRGPRQSGPTAMGRNRKEYGVHVHGVVVETVVDIGIVQGIDLAAEGAVEVDGRGDAVTAAHGRDGDDLRRIGGVPAEDSLEDEKQQRGPHTGADGGSRPCGRGVIETPGPN